MGPSRRPALRAFSGAVGVPTILIGAVFGPLSQVTSGAAETIAAVQSETPPSDLAVAEDALARNDWKEAEAGFRRVLVDDPESTQALIGWSRALARQGRGNLAVVQVKRQLERAEREGRVGDRVLLAEELVALAPDAAENHVDLGRARAADRLWQSAGEPLERALELGPRRPEWLFELARVAWENNQPRRAETLLLEAIGPGGASLNGEEETPLRVSTRNQEALRLLAAVWLWEGKAERAGHLLEALVQQARPAFASRVDFWLDLGRVRLESAMKTEGEGRDALLERSVKAYERAAELAPGASAPHYGLARALRALGDHQRSAAELETFKERVAVEREETRTRLQEEGRTSAEGLESPRRF